MSKSELHTILSSVQMSPVDRKRLVNYLNNFKNNQQQGTDEFIIKYNEDGSVDINFDDLKVAILNKNKIVLKSNVSAIDCMVFSVNENLIELMTLPAIMGTFMGDDTTSIGFTSYKIFVTENKTTLMELGQVFTLNGDGDTFLSDDGTYHDITIDTINGLSARLQSIENRIKALEDAANA